MSKPIKRTTTTTVQVHLTTEQLYEALARYARLKWSVSGVAIVRLCVQDDADVLGAEVTFTEVRDDG